MTMEGPAQQRRTVRLLRMTSRRTRREAPEGAATKTTQLRPRQRN